MVRKTKLIIHEDDYYELEVFRNGLGEVGISIGIHNLHTKEPKNSEKIMSLDNDNLDLLIDALIDLRFE